MDTQGVRKIAGLYDYGQFDFKNCGQNGQYNGMFRGLRGAHMVNNIINIFRKP